METTKGICNVPTELACKAEKESPIRSDDMSELVRLLPNDHHNQQLEANVRPADWRNPTPQGRYNLVVIGAGTAGLVTAAGAAGLGAKVALIERALFGGDCLNFGCVPSKAILRAARAAADVRDAGQFGIEVPAEVRVNFSAVMERMRRLRANISPHDSARRFNELGVDVFFGEARFTGPNRIEVGGQTLQFAKGVIATGARATEPQFPGIQAAGYRNNETIFSLTELPRRTAVIGTGPTGCEMAQAFSRFGSHVVLIEPVAHGILPNEDPDAAEVVKQSLMRDGIKLLCCSKNLHVEKSSDGKRVSFESHGEQHQIVVDEILVSVGRSPNVEKMGLETAGVQYDKLGVTVNDRLQTTNPKVYAAGDVCSRFKFTHAADAMARIVIQNSLFFWPAKVSALTIPWCTYTDPEIAHVGLYEKQAAEQGIAIQTFMQPLKDVDRAILDGETEGFVKVHVRHGTDRILGATIVARHAGEMLSEVTLAIAKRLGLKTLSKTIHPYPTQAEAIRKAGDAYNKGRLTPLVKSLLERWLRWTR